MTDGDVQRKRNRKGETNGVREEVRLSSFRAAAQLELIHAETAWTDTNKHRVTAAEPPPTETTEGAPTLQTGEVGVLRFGLQEVREASVSVAETTALKHTLHFSIITVPQIIIIINNN